jgi:hypothetical protein
MKFPFLFAFSLSLYGQTFGQSAPLPPDPSTIQGSSLPRLVMGIGIADQRGAAYPYVLDITAALHIGNTSFYSWSDCSTPWRRAPRGQPPTSSIFTTGGAWIPAQSKDGRIKPIVIIQAGVTAVQANSTIEPAISGALGLLIGLGSGFHVMPYFRVANQTIATGSSTTTTGVLQPGIQILYSFGGK